MSGLGEVVAPARFGSGFRWLLASSWTTNLGDGVALAAGPLLVASLTHDALLVSLAALLRWAPPLAFGLYAGVLSDRLNRRRIVMAAEGIRAVVLAEATSSGPAPPGAGTAQIAQTGPVCPVSGTLAGWPVSGSQIRTVPSVPAEASQMPPSAAATAHTSSTVPTWPVNGAPIGVTVFGFQTRTVPSSPAEASAARPSGSRNPHTWLTSPTWPGSRTCMETFPACAAAIPHPAVGSSTTR